MRLDSELMLAADIAFPPVVDPHCSNLAVKTPVTHAYGLRRRGAREDVCRLSAESFEFIQCFRSPISIIDAVVQYSRRANLSADWLLNETTPLLTWLRDRGVLVPPGLEDMALWSGLNLGACYQGYSILERVHVGQESLVFLARQDGKPLVALKFCSSTSVHTLQALEHEAAILQFLDGNRAPRWIECRPLFRGTCFMIEWIQGLEVMDVAAGLRGARQQRNEQELLSVCIEVVQAFADLHSVGVVHGNIGPRALRVESSGRARILHLKKAWDLASGPYSIERSIAIETFLEPESARALLEGGCPPAPSHAADQYRLAALLYEMWTGQPAVEPGSNEIATLHSICAQPKVLFEQHGIESWPALEECLKTAMSSQPQDRFSSLSEFCSRLRALGLDAARDEKGREAPSVLGQRESKVEERLREYEVGGKRFSDTQRGASMASMHYGVAGVAYGLYRIALQRESSEWLMAADAWISKADAVGSAEENLCHPRFPLDSSSIGDQSLLHSLSGVHCVRALVLIALGDFQGARLAIDQFSRLASLPSSRLDLSLGSAGLLLGCAEIFEVYPNYSESPGFRVRSVGDGIAHHLIQWIGTQSVRESAHSMSLGMAHGWAGILFALLRWFRATQVTPPPVLHDRMLELMACGMPWRNGLGWPVTGIHASGGFEDGWCRGTAGHVFWLALGYDQFRDPTWVEAALAAGESLWASNLQHGSLCCGLAGMGYAFATLYRMTGVRKWRSRADEAARRASEDVTSPCLEDSLYRGSFGAMVLGVQLRNPEHAGFPLLEPRL